MESDLEKALVQQIEKFLLELGRGFMFVGTQQRVTLNNIHRYVDMVFYNKIRRKISEEMTKFPNLNEFTG
jgi:predicted nuclease of restriction endonuclease-like (RecB) superfamily